MSGKTVAAGKRKAAFQNKKGKKQQKAVSNDNEAPTANAIDEADLSQTALDEYENDSTNLPSDSIKTATIEEKINSIEEKPNEEIQEIIPSEYASQQEANVKERQSIELFKYLDELMLCLDKTSSLGDEATNAEDLVTLCQKIAQELQSKATDILPHLSALKEIQQKIISLIKINPKIILKLNPKDQTTKVSPEVIPETIVDTEVEYSREFLVSKLWTVVSEIKHRLHRSASLLNEDPTVLGFINQSEVQKQLSTDTQKAFRDFYMDCVTETYGDELNKLREEDDFTQSRLGMLIDSIEAGMSLFPESDRALLTYTKPIQE